MARAITRPSLKIAQKSERLDISGPKTYQKPIANISVRFERKKIWLKNDIFLRPKMATLEAPGHHVWARTVERGVSNLVLGPGDRLQRFLSESESGPRQLL